MRCAYVAGEKKKKGKMPNNDGDTVSYGEAQGLDGMAECAVRRWEVKSELEFVLARVHRPRPRPATSTIVIAAHPP